MQAALQFTYRRPSSSFFYFSCSTLVGYNNRVIVLFPRHLFTKGCQAKIHSKFRKKVSNHSPLHLSNTIHPASPTSSTNTAYIPRRKWIAIIKASPSQFRPSLLLGLTAPRSCPSAFTFLPYRLSPTCRNFILQ